jgi:hypothetical protein
MNRSMRRALGEAEIAQAQADARNAHHWGEVRRIKREYDRLTEEEQVEWKPRLAAEIDEHLAALKAN